MVVTIDANPRKGLNSRITPRAQKKLTNKVFPMRINPRNRVVEGTSCLLIGCVLAATTLNAEVRFRLPLSSDTSVHYYYDHIKGGKVADWKCGTQSYDGHRGTDFSGGPRGREIYSSAVGTLDYKIDGFGDGYYGSPDGGGFGNYVRLAHTDGFKTYYAHMTVGSVSTKSIGAAVGCGELIGGVGTSGSSTGLHLHFETRKNGVSDDPYSGSCGGPISWWVNQGTGAPGILCQ